VGSLLALAEYQGRGGVRGFVLDTFSELAYGGTGQITDWGLAADVAKSTPILLAGGLTPENVTEAIRIVRPYGVDVSSGVESTPGKKDPCKNARVCRRRQGCLFFVSLFILPAP
jgi:phosphoribosylanthranilate isomerase